MKEYSKVYKGRRGTKFRYNYKHCLIEWVSNQDVDIEGNLINLENYEVVDCQGLKKENWEDNKEYWIDQYETEIEEFVNEELKYL
jgi:hypothetical protein